MDFWQHICRIGITKSTNKTITFRGGSLISVIWVTGIQGAGKSTLARSLENRFALIHVDLILKEGAKTLAPNAENPYSWILWRNLCTDQPNKAHSVLSRVLAKELTEHCLLNVSDPVVCLEGSSLCVRQLLQALKKAIKSLASDNIALQEQFIFINPPIPQVLQQVHKRGRKNETHIDKLYLQKQQAALVKNIENSNKNWIVCENAESAKNSIRSFLNDHG